MRDKSEKFKELGEKRVNKAINQIRLVANLANRNNYEYSEEQAQKIIGALDNELRTLKSKFASEGQQRRKFRL